MNALDIKFFPDPILKTKCNTVNSFDNSLRQFIESMKNTMYQHEGIGLAANQVGEVLRVFVMDTVVFQVNIESDSSEQNDIDGALPDTSPEDVTENEPDQKEPREAICFINPEISKMEGEITYSEGCLSIPGVREDIKRHQSIVLKYQDEYGNPKEEAFANLAAVCIQHEVDHLNGMIIFDRLPVIKRKIVKTKYLKSLMQNESA